MICDIFLVFLIWINLNQLSECIEVDVVLWTPMKVNSDYYDYSYSLSMYLYLDFKPLAGTTFLAAGETCQRLEKCKLFCLVNGEYQQSELEIHPEYCTSRSDPTLLDCWTSGL